MRLLIISLTTISLIAVTACGDQSAKQAPEGPIPVATLTDGEASDEVQDAFAFAGLGSRSLMSLVTGGDSNSQPDVVAACGHAITSIESYRYQFDSSVSLPIGQNADEAHEPIQINVDGTFQAPDRFHVIPRVSFNIPVGSGNEETIVIGDQVWRKRAGMWVADPSSDAIEALNLATAPPGGDEEYCRDTAKFTSVDGLESQEEELSGFAVTHYRLDTDDINSLSALEPASPDEPVAEFVAAEMNIWLDKESYAMLKAQFSGTIRLEDQDAGRSAASWEFDISFEIFDIDDPSISIEPPI